MQPLTNSKVDHRCGDVLRRWRRKQQIDNTELSDAFRLLRQYRESFQYPLTKANMGLRSCVRTALRRDIPCTQRLKQPPRIMDKLLRKPTMRLSQMEDIGGCRTVLPDLVAVYRVRDRIVKLGRVLYEDDANKYDRETGYRALHLVTDYDGRRIELQLRTDRQQEWASHVEELDDQFGTDLKDGGGPEELQNYLRHLADGYSQLDNNGRLGADWITGYNDIRNIAESYIRMAMGFLGDEGEEHDGEDS